MNHISSKGRARRLTMTMVVLSGLLAGCMGIDVTSVRRIETSTQAPSAEEVVALGRIQFMVDGRFMDYGLLNKPHLSLYHHQRDVLMSSPETRADGSYRWLLPAGDYTVAVVFGGMTPGGQALRLPSGQVIHVNGIVNPGAAFTLRAGAEADLGTLIVQVESRPARGLLRSSERVFARFVGVRVEPPGHAGTDHPSRPAPLPMQILANGTGSNTHTKAPVRPTVLAPLLPMLLR